MGTTEICQGVKCVPGCRSSSDCPITQACDNNQCIDPCTIAQCGVNAICITQNHKPFCSCPPGMTGDPLASCDMPMKSCKNNLQCGAGSLCSDGICASKCVSSDQDCLPNEVCKSGVCKRICSINDQCGDNQVCIDRMCVKGCLTSQQCPGNQVSSGNQCRDPCQDNPPCGDCASCQVVSHQVQCSCPAGAAG